MLSYKQYLIEGTAKKFKVGNEPSFRNKDKAEISKRLRDFVKMYPDYQREIHYPADGQRTKGYADDNQMEVKITSDTLIRDLEKYMSIFSVQRTGKDLKVVNKSGVFLFKFSSGRGFFYASEGKQTTPTIAQQETGTIKTLEYMIMNKKEPSHNEVNDMVGFVFDDGWYSNFIHSSKAILEFVLLSPKYAIHLDSDSKSIGSHIFSMLKRKFSFKVAKDNWNPSDIWIFDSSKKSFIITELDTTQSIVDFNAKLKQLFDQKILLGVSLKKVTRKTTAKIVDTSKVKPFKLEFAPCSYNINNTYWDIETSGYPDRFMIRARAKAKSISNKNDIKIYFEGKLKNSSEFLGSIPTNLIKWPGSDTTTFDVTKDMVVDLINKVTRISPMNIVGQDKLDNMDEMKLLYTYVMLRYAESIYEKGLDNLKTLAMAGFKMNDYSSIHLKVGG